MTSVTWCGVCEPVEKLTPGVGLVRVGGAEHDGLGPWACWTGSNRLVSVAECMKEGLDDRWFSLILEWSESCFLLICRSQKAYPGNSTLADICCSLPRALLLIEVNNNLQPFYSFNLRRQVKYHHSLKLLTANYCTLSLRRIHGHRAIEINSPVWQSC